MAGRKKCEIRDQDVQGLKCLRKIGPLLSRLRKVGTERDRACGLDKVRKRLGVTRASLGSLSESVAIFDPAPLEEIAVELGHTIRSRPNGRFDAVGQRQ
ncbi:MAG: hypothetical protein EBZ74_11445 [Planctomycetia bacterium]|nr:hypothetical protein [Planctomycetia bacterium]